VARRERRRSYGDWRYELLHVMNFVPTVIGDLAAAGVTT
jgi:hypothetical protein